MRLATRRVEVVLSEEGQTALRLAGVDLPEALLPMFFVDETDELGLWIRATRNDGLHSILIRWEYVLSLDLVPLEAKKIGVAS